MRPGLGPLRRGVDRFRDDLQADPYLRGILLLALVLAGFGIWHGVPNFSTWDARDRFFHPLAVYAHFLSDPGIASVREGLGWSREPFGATFYLNALVILPLLIVAAFVGALEDVAAVPTHDTAFGFFAAWQATPEWFWTWGIVLSRAVTVCFAVGCVYLTYRLAVAVGDRTTGRIAATLLALSFGFLMLTKEIGEDVPALFVLLCSLYLLVRYVQSGRRRLLYAGSAVGGFALAVKLTLAPIVVLVPAAHALRVHVVEGEPLESAWNPRLLGVAAGLGAAGLLVGFPAALGLRFDLLLDRFVFHTGYRIIVRKGPEASSWWWLLRGYLHGFGLPLALASVAGVAARVRQLRRGEEGAADLWLLVLALGLFLVMLLSWQDFRVHHLLPTFPLIHVLLAGSAARLLRRRPAVARPLLAALLLATAAYAGVGTAQYASTPHDQAGEWIEANVPDDATMETYRQTFDNAAVGHGVDTTYPGGGGAAADCPEFVQLTYRDLTYLRDVPDDHRGYYADENVSERADYVRAFVEGETNYELAAEFGPRPPEFVPRRATPNSVLEVLHLGVYPHTDQYGDEQDLRPNQYVALFERTGPCEQPRSVPW